VSGVEKVVDKLGITRQLLRRGVGAGMGCGKFRKLPRVFSHLLIAMKYKKNKSLS
jgi:hypothetical protein